MRLIRWGLAVIAVLLITLVVVLAFNTLRLKAEPLAQSAPVLPVDMAAVQRLSGAIRIPTVSTEAAPAPDPVLDAFAAYLAANFPRVHAQLRREVVAGHSLLFTWPGSDPSAPATLLAAHQDVVPIDPGSENHWQQQPFSGAIAGGYVWGRGAIDDKAALMAILEAAERQLAEGQHPRGTLYLAFGHDEERAGSGAAAIAALLKQRGVKLGLVLDEGEAVTKGVIPGVKPPVALIGLAEKGYVSVEMIAHAPGGHSSMPSGDNAAVRIARAVTRVADDPFPVRMERLTGKMLDAIAPYMDTPMRGVLANRWLTGGIVKKKLLQSPESAASLRTTTAPTILAAGTKENVLPQTARAVVNHRILPGDTIASTVAHDMAAVNDPHVAMKALAGGHDPSATASTDSPDYARVAGTIRRIFPEAAVAPALTLGATDGRHYEGIARSVLRFLPVTMDKSDLARFHGTNERISIQDYMRAIAFYEALMAN